MAAHRVGVCRPESCAGSITAPLAAGRIGSAPRSRQRRHDGRKLVVTGSSPVPPISIRSSAADTLDQAVQTCHLCPGCARGAVLGAVPTAVLKNSHPSVGATRRAGGFGCFVRFPAVSVRGVVARDREACTRRCGRPWRRTRWVAPTDTGLEVESNVVDDEEPLLVVPIEMDSPALVGLHVVVHLDVLLACVHVPGVGE